MTPLHLFHIQTGSTEPIYRQLLEQLRRLVASAQLSAGQELPSVRELAAHLAVNPMTVSKAYGLMEAEGLVERQRGLPMRVAPAAGGAGRAAAPHAGEGRQRSPPAGAQARAGPAAVPDHS